MKEDNAITLPSHPVVGTSNSNSDYSVGGRKAITKKALAYTVNDWKVKNKPNFSFSTMQPQQTQPESDFPPIAAVKIRTSSPRYPQPTTPSSTNTPTANAQRRIGIAVDLSDESAFAVKWAVHHYLRPGDAVILIHVRPTSVLYGADWGSVDLTMVDDTTESKQKLEDDFDAFTVTKVSDLSQPLVEAHIPFKIHIVKDHDMKERLCLEVERLGLSAVIMGSRGFGAMRGEDSRRLGSVSDYCVRHCVCPVVVLRYPDDRDGRNAGGDPVVSVASAAEDEEEPVYLED